MPSDPKCDFDKLLRYMKSVMEQIVEADYTIVYLHNGLHSKVRLSLSLAYLCTLALACVHHVESHCINLCTLALACVRHAESYCMHLYTLALKWSSIHALTNPPECSCRNYNLKINQERKLP